MKIQSAHKIDPLFSEVVDLQSDTHVFLQWIQSQGWMWVGEKKLINLVLL